MSAVTILVLLVGSTYVLIKVALTLARNHKAHQFFKVKAPKLPVVPRPNILTGNVYNVIYHDKNCLTIDRLHKQYGPTFGYYMTNQAWVSTKDLDLIKLIELDKPARHINRAKLDIPFKPFNKSIFQVDDEEWRRQRRAIAPALTNYKVRGEQATAGIKSILQMMEDGIKFRLSESDVGGEQSAILHLNDTFMRYTFAVIFNVVYDCDGKIDFRADREMWSSRMEEAARALQHPIVAVAVIVPFMRPLLELLANFHAAGRMTNKIIKYIGKATDLNMIRARSSSTVTKQQPSSESNKTFDNRQRLVDTIIDSLVNKRLDHEEFVNGLFFLQLAGVKTTADTLTWLVWQLSRYTHIQEQLRDSILKDGIESDYLSWCIKETIRIHPAVPLGTGRILGEDVTVNGLFLPKGTFVMPSTYSIHHDPDIWPEPDEFKPERWRDTTDHHPAAFMGFGLGPRNCLGGKLAVQEMKLAMQLLLGNYRFEVCSETAAESAFSSPLMLFTNSDRSIKVRLVALSKDHKRH